MRFSKEEKKAIWETAHLWSKAAGHTRKIGFICPLCKLHDGFYNSDSSCSRCPVTRAFGGSCFQDGATHGRSIDGTPPLKTHSRGWRRWVAQCALFLCEVANVKLTDEKGNLVTWEEQS